MVTTECYNIQWNLSRADDYHYNNNWIKVKKRRF